MAEDFSFRVKNTLVVNGAFVANSTVVNAAAITATSVTATSVNATSVNTATANATTSIVVGANVVLNTTTVQVGNATVNTAVTAGQISISGVAVNSTVYQGTSNNASNLGGQPNTFYTNATNLATGTVPVARLSGTYVITANNATNLNGQADTFYTNATNLSTGTVPVARMSGTYAITANNATNLGGQPDTFYTNATNLSTGTVPAARLSGTYVITANNATNLGGQPNTFYTNATNLSTGTVPTARLSGTYNITVDNSTSLNSQAASFYTDIPARLGYTPVNRAGDTSMAGNYTTTGAEIRIGSGQDEEKRLRLHNFNRNVYFYLFGTTLGLYDLTSATNRWTTDTSGNFTATGNITAFSDIKLKTNIHTIEDALFKVAHLRGVTYDRKSDNTPQIGVIAQEVKEVLPEVVVEDDNGILSVAYGNIVGLLIEAVKELSSEVKSLRAKVDTLEERD
jgi:hypothetical protein